MVLEASSSEEAADWVQKIREGGWCGLWVRDECVMMDGVCWWMGGAMMERTGQSLLQLGEYGGVLYCFATFALFKSQNCIT